MLMKDFDDIDTEQPPVERTQRIHIDGTDEQRVALFAALAAAQGETGSAGKDATNEKFGEYATLKSYIDALRPAFKTHGLFHAQAPVEGSGTNVHLETIVGHKGGGCLRAVSSITLALGNKATNDLQVRGISISYERRYALAALTGMAAGDSDGELEIAADFTMEQREILMIAADQGKAAFVKAREALWDEIKDAYTQQTVTVAVLRNKVQVAEKALKEKGDE